MSDGCKGGTVMGQKGIREESPLTEEEISMVLDTYMYLNYKEADDGMTLSEIISDLSTLPDYGGGGIHYGEYSIISQAAENPEIGNLVIGSQSHYMGYDQGTAACTFQSRETTYVVYRGTGDGEWMDNGLGMTQAETIQQRQALSYFEEIVERQNILPQERLVITGHSKGGNKAQFVTMSTQYEALIDACYNIDGQGFSEAAVEGWKTKYGEEGYSNRAGKITGIYGENDFINGLGNSIVPGEQIFYIKTPVEKGNIAGYHDIKYLFAQWETDSVSGEEKLIFKGRKNTYAAGQGELSSYAALLSAGFMWMEPERRDGCAAFLMQCMELGGKKKTGQNGEKLTLSDVEDFCASGISMIAGSILITMEERKKWKEIGINPGFTEEMQGSVILFIKYGILYREAEELAAMAGKLLSLHGVIGEIANKLPLIIKNGGILSYKIGKEEKNLLKRIKELEKLSETLFQIIDRYEASDTKMAEEIDFFAGIM